MKAGVDTRHPETMVYVGWMLPTKRLPKPRLGESPGRVGDLHAHDKRGHGTPAWLSGTPALPSLEHQFGGIPGNFLGKAATLCGDG